MLFAMFTLHESAVHHETVSFSELRIALRRSLRARTATSVLDGECLNRANTWVRA